MQANPVPYIGKGITGGCVVWSFPWALIHSPYRCKGIDLPNLHMEQTIGNSRLEPPCQGDIELMQLFAHHYCSHHCYLSSCLSIFSLIPLNMERYVTTLEVMCTTKTISNILLFKCSTCNDVHTDNAESNLCDERYIPNLIHISLTKVEVYLIKASTFQAWMIGCYHGENASNVGFNT